MAALKAALKAARGTALQAAVMTALVMPPGLTASRAAGLPANQAPSPAANAPAAVAGDPVQGQAIASSRSTGLCVLCHAMPGVPAVHSGTLGPDLTGVAGRYPRAQLRERFLTPERFNPQTVMPAPLRGHGLQRVAAARQGQGLLTPQQAADVLAWLETLQ